MRTEWTPEQVAVRGDERHGEILRSCWGSAYRFALRAYGVGGESRAAGYADAILQKYHGPDACDRMNGR